MSRPIAALLSEGRLHLQHGPIDIVIGAEGAGRGAALSAANRRFATILDELVAELPALRQPAGTMALSGSVARRMAVTTRIARGVFMTPMAAVAGAVADEILSVMKAVGRLDRAYVNNGGDIAVHLGRGAQFDVGIAGLVGARFGTVSLKCDHNVAGIATSGAGGRSLSFGIAESVTVLAKDAATADAAATLIASAVDLPGHPAIRRARASDLDPDSDLGGNFVTTNVLSLSPDDRRAALNAGLVVANRLRADGTIAAAALFLQGAHVITSSPGLLTPEPESIAYA